MKIKDKFLYESFLSMLFQNDSNQHSCLNDLRYLKDYQSIITKKLEVDIDHKFEGLYRQHARAENMKQYIEQNLVECYAINEWELLVELKNGDKFIYDSFNNTVRFNLYGDDGLTEEQELKEFGNNLRRLLQHRFMSQEELASIMGVTRLTINRYINGTRVPDYLTLSKMARALKCSVDDLYYRHF